MEANNHNSFQTYIGTKMVKAMPMGAGDAKRYGANITEETIIKNCGVAGYLVEYEDGYRSWSPAKTFEGAYRIGETHVDRMKIELADLSTSAFARQQGQSAPSVRSPKMSVGNSKDSWRRCTIMQMSSMTAYAVQLSPAVL